MGLSLTPLEKQILNNYQRNFPLSRTPYADIAHAIGTTEEQVLEAMKHLMEQGIISRVGAVLAPGRTGVSTLAAMTVPEEHLKEMAELINSFPEVNHNYERENILNLWFVMTAPTLKHLQDIVIRIESISGLSVHTMPMEEDYHIDLGFPLIDHRVTDH